ncbi:hypothetical protein AB3480_00620 [Rhizobium mongolense]|uniref:hypothetical protein n=1 Tax=Rhizobium mongolense TaxID=57676 RepID=UPI0034A4C1D9
MSTWSFDLTTAPRDRKLWLASECGKVIPTTWDKKREQWAGFATNGKPPVAWQEFIVPEHPGARSDLDAIADRLIVHKHQFIEDVGSGA